MPPTNLEPLLTYIEAETTYLEHQLQRAIHAFLGGETVQERYIEPLLPSIRQIERQAEVWVHGIPDDPQVRARLAAQLNQKYGISSEATPMIWEGLSLSEEAIQSAYRDQFGHELDTLTGPIKAGVKTTWQIPFDWIEDRDVEVLKNSLTRVSLSGGEVLFREGDSAEDGAYIITSGRVEVSVHDADGQVRVVTECGQDALIGEIALLTNSARSATVTAMRDTELFRITYDAFGEIVRDYPQVSTQIATVIAKRTVDASRRQKHVSTVVNIAIIPAGKEADIEGFTQELLQVLTTQYDVLYVNQSSLAEQFEPGVADSLSDTTEAARLLSWLNRQEELFDFIIYEADKDLSEWTKRCLRQADRILVVGQSDRSKEPGNIEGALYDQQQFRTNARIELVLLHSAEQQLPQHTRGWLEQRPVDDYHHVSIVNPDHFKRLARFLVGRPVALVFSGGGTRAFAHIGALRALAEHNIPIDWVGGTSSGAIVAAGVAFGWSPDHMEALWLDQVTKGRKILDFTLPFTSIIAGKRFSAILQTVFGDANIEDLWTHYYATTADLTSAELRTHRAGVLWRAIQGSCTLPMLMPPWLDENNHLLIDGGLITGLPIYPMNEFVPNSFLIAVDISQAFYGADELYNYGNDLSFLKVLNSKLNPFAKKIISPSIINVLLRTIELSSVGTRSPQIALLDAHIRPPVKPTSLIDAKAAQEHIQTGYEAAMNVLKDVDLSLIKFR